MSPSDHATRLASLVIDDIEPVARAKLSADARAEAIGIVDDMCRTAHRYRSKATLPRWDGKPPKDSNIRQRKRRYEERFDMLCAKLAAVFRMPGADPVVFAVTMQPFVRWSTCSIHWSVDRRPWRPTPALGFPLDVVE